MTKGIPQRIVDEMDKEFRDSSYNMLDKVEATAYHPKAYGLTLEEWISFIEDYAKEKDRKYFFGLNNLQRPTVFWDATNKQEWDKKQKLVGNQQVKFWADQGYKRIKPKGKINRFEKIDDDKKQSTKK